MGLGFSALLKVFRGLLSKSYETTLDHDLRADFFGSFIVFALVARLRPSRPRALLLAVLLLLFGTALDVFFTCSSPHPDRGSVSAHRGLLHHPPIRRSAALRHREFVDRLAAHLVRCRLSRRRRLFDGGRDLSVCAGAGASSRAACRLPRLGMVPLSDPSGCLIYVLAPRGLEFRFVAGSLRDAAMASRLRACIPVAFLCARSRFAGVERFATAASRRFGASVVAFCDDLAALRRAASRGARRDSERELMGAHIQLDDASLANARVIGCGLARCRPTRRRGVDGGRQKRARLVVLNLCCGRCQRPRARAVGSQVPMATVFGNAVSLGRPAFQGIRTQRRHHYYNTLDDEARRTERIVCIQLGFMNNARVLTAWCELRAAFRFFRTDRIGAAPAAQPLPGTARRPFARFPDELRADPLHGERPDRK